MCTELPASFLNKSTVIYVNNNFLFQIILTVGLFSLAMADVSEIVGKNQYLPPSKGYNYDRPSIPFPSSPAARPTPSYQTPFPSRPAYQAPTPSYQPPSSGYIPPASTPRPHSRPLPAYQPGGASSGNQGTYVGPSSGGGDVRHQFR